MFLLFAITIIAVGWCPCHLYIYIFALKQKQKVKIMNNFCSIILFFISPFLGIITQKGNVGSGVFVKSLKLNGVPGARRTWIWKLVVISVFRKII